jgi:hypothetical protein
MEEARLKGGVTESEFALFIGGGWELGLGWERGADGRRNPGDGGVEVIAYCIVSEEAEFGLAVSNG